LITSLNFTMAATNTKYQERIVSTPTVFNHPEEDGFWRLVDCNGDGSLDLVFIKFRNAQSGMVEVFYTTGESRFQASPHCFITYFTLAVGNSGTFLMHDMTGNGKADLIFIQPSTYGGTYHLNIDVASAESEYRTIIFSFRSSHYLSSKQHAWSMAENRDLIYVKTSECETNTIEYISLTRASDYKDIGFASGSGFSMAAKGAGTFRVAPKRSGIEPRPDAHDLYFINSNESITGTVSVLGMSASSSWKTEIFNEQSGFHLENDEDGVWLLADWTHQPRPDLVYIKSKHTGSGKTEVHINPYSPHTPHSYMDSCRNPELVGTILTADLKRNDDTWHSSSIDLDMFIGAVNGKFTWQQKYFSRRAQYISLQESSLKAELYNPTNGTWSFDTFELRERLFNNDGAFQAVDVPVIVAISPEQEQCLLRHLAEALESTALKLHAKDAEDGSGATTFYYNAGTDVDSCGVLKTYTAEGRLSVMHLCETKGKPIEQVNVDVFTAHSGVTTAMIEGQPVYAGFEAGVSLVQAQASIFDLNLGVGIESGVGLKDGSLDLHAAGCGFQVGRKCSISVFGSSFGVDLGRLPWFN